MRKEQKLNNKGFSLVELIIVIAIMAVLVAVLAPQFLKYVERARNSTDVSNATEIVTALQVAAADPTFMDEANHNLEDTTIEVTDSAVTGIKDGFFKDALENANITPSTCKSKSAWKKYSIIVKAVGGGLTFDYADDAFKSAMTKGSVSSN